MKRSAILKPENPEKGCRGRQPKQPQNAGAGAHMGAIKTPMGFHGKRSLPLTFCAKVTNNPCCSGTDPARPEHIKYTICTMRGKSGEGRDGTRRIKPPGSRRPTLYPLSPRRIRLSRLLGLVTASSASSALPRAARISWADIIFPAWASLTSLSTVANVS